MAWHDIHLVHGHVVTRKCVPTSKVPLHYAVLVLCVMLEKLQFIEPYFLHTTHNGTWYILQQGLTETTLTTLWIVLTKCFCSEFNLSLSCSLAINKKNAVIHCKSKIVLKRTLHVSARLDINLQKTFTAKNAWLKQPKEWLVQFQWVLL